jgi:hypothetical protein
MRISSFISFIGFAIVLVATFCPLAHFLAAQRTIYQVNQPYGIVLLLISVVGIIGCVFSNQGIARLMVWFILALIILLLIAALFKMDHYFNFMPFHLWSKALNSKIKFSWGWYVMCVGGIIALAGTFAKKPMSFSPAEKDS